MTLAQLLAAVYDETGYASSPASAVTTRITRYLNDGYRLVLSEPGLMRVQDSIVPYSFASVASTAVYTMPEYVSVIEKMTERTNDRTLYAMSLDQYRQIEPDPPSVTGTPVAYVPLGRTALATQPSDASILFAKSSNAADTTQTVTLVGILATTSNMVTLTSAVLTGTTALQLPGNVWTEISDIYLSAATAGNITITEDSGVGTQLALINAGKFRTDYFAFALWPTPASAVTYYVDYRRDIVDMSVTTDAPILPPSFHQMLVDYAVMREFELKKDTERVVIAQKRFQMRLSRLKYQTQSLQDELPTMGWNRRVGHSRLGPYFPADTWTRF